MVARCRWIGLVLLAIGGLTLTVAAAAVAPEVNDQGKFFSAEAIKKANDELRTIAAKYDLDVLVETFPTPPAERLEKFKTLDAKGKADFFNHWAKERADHCVVHGIYILLCREPEYFFIGVTKRGQGVFPPEVRNELRKEMGKEFSKGRFDEGLAVGLSFVADRLAKVKAK